MESLELVSTGGALPKRSVHNDDLAKIMDTNDEWIYTRTGIHSRYFCEGEENVTSLATAAARQAMERAGVTADEIGCLVAATCSGDYATPAESCLVQSALGLPDDIPVTDVNAACTGFIYATEVARGFLQESEKPYALVIGAEQISRYLDMTDRSTAVLFGDGAGAAIFRKTPGSFYHQVLGAMGGLEINVPGAASDMPEKVSMDGKAVFRFATKAMRRGIETLMEKSGKTYDDIDWFICHQANSRIIDHVVRKMKAPPEKFFEDMERFGNTSGASVPIAINDMNEQHLLSAGQTLVLVGFGSGLTWGGLMLKCAPDFRAAT
jgi:3-oxoacyl-[acyl-carrier-protein] synthase-3